ncbi:MAG: 50S ribosomal protein L4 [Candidatus Kariarchaeaceae archaeon]|jgi:large subunit ribosomal protein L4e
MEKVTVLNLKGNPKKAKIDLPVVFSTIYRPDLIKRAVLSEQSYKKQPQGRFPLAGRQGAATSLQAGRALAKIPRTHGKRTHHGNRGTRVNSTVGGRLAFPPKTDKVIAEKINKKEKRYALKSAISATANKEIVENRGHVLSEKSKFPLIIEDAVSDIIKTKEIADVLDNLGLSDDLTRTKPKKIRAGKGKMRGRKYRRKTGPLLVVAEDCSVLKAGSNIPGVVTCKVQDLTVELLAPGTHPGRLTIWTEGAIKKLAELK